MAVHAPSMGAPNRAPFATGNSPTSDDGTILAAFKRFQDAHAAYDATPDVPPESDETYTPEQNRLWNLIDRADDEVGKLLAHTPQGVACKLWLAIIHISDDPEAERAAIRADLSWFEQRGEALDWNQRLIVTALRSLTDMTARQAALLGGDRSNMEHALPTPTQAPGAPQPTKFAPLGWLADFEHVGGAYALTEAGLHLCVIPGDRSVEELGKARLLIASLSSEDRSAIADELRGRQVMEACHGDH